MEIVQVQPAGAVAPTLPASAVLSATPTGDGSFALTLGRALENMPNSVQDGSSIAPQASPREKRAAGNSSDSSSMAGIFLNCFVTNLIQPALTVAPSTKAAESTVSLQSPAAETTADSLPNLDSGLDTSAGETSANTGTLSIAVAKGGVAVPGELSAWAGQGVGTMGTAKAEASKPTARARGQVANQFSGPLATTGQKQSEDTSAPQPVSVPAWVPGLHGTSPLSHPVEQQVGGAQSESNQVQSSSPRSAQESGLRQESQASPSFAYSWPQLEQVDHAQMQAAPAPGSEASDSSTLFSATDHPALAESSSPLGKFAGADVQAASNPSPSLGQTQQAAPASRPEANDSSTLISATERPVLAEFSNWLGTFAGADVQATINAVVSSGQTDQSTPASGPEANDSSTLISVTERPALAEFSNWLGKFAGADMQAASNLSLSLGQTDQSTPASGPEARDSSTPISATDHPELAEFSSLLGTFAGADVQAASNPTLSPGQMGQASPAIAAVARDSSIRISGTDHPELAEFSSLLGKFVGAEINVKVSGNESQQAMAPDEFTTKSTPVAAGTLSGGLRNTAVDSIQIPAASKSGDLANNPAKGAIHSAQVSSSAVTETVWQKGNEPEAASAQTPLSSSASPVPSPQLDADSQPATPAMTMQKDAAPVANGIQPSGTVSADSGESAAYANPSDPSTSGQGKSGQQSEPGSGDDPAGVKIFTPDLANNPAADSTASLLTAHAPTVPASPANTSAPQTAPSSSQPATTLSAWQNYDGGAGQMVRSASLNDSANGAEMHVELRSGALGPLEVHAVLHEGSLGAEIHVQGQEAHTLLAAGLPSLERALGERNLRVENIAVYQDHAGGGMSGGEKQDPHSGSSSTPQRQVLPWDNPPQATNSASGSSEDAELANPAAGLSVRA